MVAEDPAEPPADAPAAGSLPPAAPVLVLDDPIFEDPRADAVVVLPLAPATAPYPVVINAQVEALMDYFSARERERFGMWISRSGRYLTMIRRVFRERGLPEELAYTAMIESGFSPRAVSRVGAKGMWQFMEATGRRYGLKVDRWVDERFDPLKATVAAAQYLGDLYGMFGHWFLAQAAYNAGEARVARAIQRAKTSDFWALDPDPAPAERDQALRPADPRRDGDQPGPRPLRLRRRHGAAPGVRGGHRQAGRSTSRRSPGWRK